jgi:hypothetical protein
MKHKTLTYEMYLVTTPTDALPTKANANILLNIMGTLHAALLKYPTECSDGFPSF